MSDSTEILEHEAPATEVQEYVPLTRSEIDAVIADPTLIDSMDKARREELNEYMLDDKPLPEESEEVLEETPEQIAEREALEAGTRTEAAAPREEEAAGPTEAELSAAQLKSLAERKTAYKSEIEKLNAVIKTPLPADKFSDEYAEAIEKRQDALDKKFELKEKFDEETERATVATHTATVETAALEQEFKSMDAIQDRYPEVRTGVPAKQAISAYAKHWSKLVAASPLTDGNEVERFNATRLKMATDPTFAAVHPELKDPANFQQMIILNEAATRAKSGGSARLHLLDILDKQGVFAARETAAGSAAARAAAEAATAALDKGRNSPRPSTVDGKSKTPVANALKVPTDYESAKAYAENNLRKREGKIPLTKFESEHLARAEELLGL